MSLLFGGTARTDGDGLLTPSIAHGLSEVSVVPMAITQPSKDAGCEAGGKLDLPSPRDDRGLIKGTLQQQLEEIQRRFDEDDKVEELIDGTVRFEFTYKSYKSKCAGSALHVAVQQAFGADATRLLLDAKADVNEALPYNDNQAMVFPIHLVTQSGEPEIIKLLVEAQADVNAASRRGEEDHFWPLHEAAFFVQPEVTQCLIDFAADINMQNSDKLTPLHVAAKRGAADVAEILVYAGASKDALDKQDRSPLTIAVEAGVFPARRLHLLGNWCIADVVTVAQHAPSATEEFLHGMYRENQGREFKGLGDAIIVADCGEREANGLWCQDDTDTDRPRYSKKDWEGAAIAWDPVNCRWRMTFVESEESHERILFVSTEVSDNVPDGGWVAYDGKSPPPTVIPDTRASMVSHWIELMARAPDAGDELLEILSVAPAEESVYHHALPTQAMMTEMKCEYKLEKCWEFFPDGMTTKDSKGKKVKDHNNQRPRQWPEWHDRLAPKPQELVHRRATSQLSAGGLNKGAADTLKDTVSAVHRMHRNLGEQKKLHPVHIRLLQMPGVISAEVLQVFASTEHLGIFRSNAAQAILNYTWDSFVRRYHTAQLIHRIIELMILVSLIWWAPTAVAERGTADSFWYQLYLHCSCSILFVVAVKDTVAELCQLRGYLSILFIPEAYFLNLLNYVDLATIALFDVYAFHMLFSLTDGPILQKAWLLRVTAVVSFAKWIQLMYTLRPYKLAFIGVNNFIPILHSFKNIGGMFIIVCFFFGGFAHAAIILEDKPYLGIVPTIVYIFRGLVMSDGDGVNTMLALGDVEDQTGDITTRVFLFASIVTFCIVLLNVFIAVIGEAYAAAFREGAALHLQERASICVNCMFQPEWPPQRGLLLNILKAVARFGSRCRCCLVRCLCCRCCRCRCSTWCRNRYGEETKGSTARHTWRLPCAPEKAYFLMLLAIMPVWVGLLAGGALRAARGGKPIDSIWAFMLHPVFPSLVLLFVELVAGSLLCQRPWERETERQRSYLWWCTPVTVNRVSADQDKKAEAETLPMRLGSLEARIQELLTEWHATHPQSPTAAAAAPSPPPGVAKRLAKVRNAPWQVVLRPATSRPASSAVGQRLAPRPATAGATSPAASERSNGDAPDAQDLPGMVYRALSNQAHSDVPSVKAEPSVAEILDLEHP